MIERLDDLGIVTVPAAAELLGVTPSAVSKAMLRGTLPARCIGSGKRAVWITTREDVARYRAEHSERRRRPRA